MLVTRYPDCMIGRNKHRPLTPNLYLHLVHKIMFQVMHVSPTEAPQHRRVMDRLADRQTVNAAVIPRGQPAYASDTKGENATVCGI